MFYLKKLQFFQKHLSMHLFIPSLKYQVINILLNHLLHRLRILIIKVASKKGTLVFYNKYLDWDSVNK